MNRQYFLHIGMHKTASTYLQKHIFPNFKDVDYYHGLSSLKGMLFTLSNNKIIISHESFQGSPIKTIKVNGPKGWIKTRNHRFNILRDLFPKANIILVLRQHGQWISSMYRQYLHQGGLLDYKDFFSIKEDKLIERKGLIYSELVESIMSTFNGNLLCINYNGLKNNNEKAVDVLQNFIGSTLENKKKSVQVNVSVKNYQAKLLKKINFFTESLYDDPVQRLTIFKRSGILNKFGFSSQNVVRKIHFLRLFGSDVVNANNIEVVNDFYKDDWQWVINNIGPVAKVFEGRQK